MDNKKGFYIVFEGIDSSGKSSLVNNLLDRFKNNDIDAIKTFEFGSTIFGKKMRELFYSYESDWTKFIYPIPSGLLFLSDHIQHQEELIRPSLEQGKIVLQDRFFPISQRVYWEDDGENNPAIMCHELIHKECIKPDMVIMLTIDPYVAYERAKERGDSKFLAKPWSLPEKLSIIQNRYLSMSNICENLFVMDVTQKGKEEVADTVFNEIIKCQPINTKNS